MRYAAVFFDAGETLVHPHPTFPDLFAEVLRREGHDVDADTVRSRIHVVFERFERAAKDNELWTTSPERSRRFWHDVYRIFLRDLDIPDPDGLVDRLYAEFSDLANYRLFEDVPPVLDRLAGAGLRLGIVSNFEEWLEQLLEELGVLGRFDVRVVSGVEGMEKPDPRIFRLALDRAGVEPGEAVYVGDDPVMDIAPATAVGMMPVLIDRRGRFPDAEGLRLASMAERLGRIRDARRVVIETARLVHDRIQADGGGVAGEPAYFEAARTLRAEVEYLAERDVVLRDPETGLIDFLGEVEGRRVWLCWRLGEDRVTHYHELDSGFVGRKPL